MFCFPAILCLYTKKVAKKKTLLFCDQHMWSWVLHRVKFNSHAKWSATVAELRWYYFSDWSCYIDSKFCVVHVFSFILPNKFQFGLIFMKKQSSEYYFKLKKYYLKDKIHISVIDNFTIPGLNIDFFFHSSLGSVSEKGFGKKYILIDKNCIRHRFRFYQKREFFSTRLEKGSEVYVIERNEIYEWNRDYFHNENVSKWKLFKNYF